MATIPAVDVIGAKWARVTPQRAADYEAGVRNPKRAWAQATLAAKDAYTAGIQASLAAKSFEKGVQKAGDGVWQTGAVEKGVPRWGQGVALAQDKYQTAIAPYVAAIGRVSLPPRYARRDPRNLERVKAIVDALAKVKAGGG